MMIERKTAKIPMAQFAYDYLCKQGINRVCSSVSHAEFSELVREYYKAYQQEDKCPPYPQARNDIAMHAIRSTKIGRKLFVKTGYVMN